MNHWLNNAWDITAMMVYRHMCGCFEQPESQWSCVITAVLIKHSFLKSIRLFSFCSCRSNKVVEQAQSSSLHPFMHNCVNEACACASKRMRFTEENQAYVELQNRMKKRILSRVLCIWPLMLRGESRQVLLLLWPHSLLTYHMNHIYGGEA